MDTNDRSRVWSRRLPICRERRAPRDHTTRPFLSRGHQSQPSGRKVSDDGGCILDQWAVELTITSWGSAHRNRQLAPWLAQYRPTPPIVEPWRPRPAGASDMTDDTVCVLPKFTSVILSLTDIHFQFCDYVGGVRFTGILHLNSGEGKNIPGNDGVIDIKKARECRTPVMAAAGARGMLGSIIW